MAPYLLARRIHNRLTNDIRRGHNSHRQGDLYRSSNCGCAHRPRRLDATGAFGCAVT
ncbi:uncharacterized protein METZ01_LOCUS278055, partial [marine metagenome]